MTPAARRPHWGEETSWNGREVLEQTYGEARADEMRGEGPGVPMQEERKPSAVLKAEYLAMKGRKG
ncbi:MAG: hypothetical protein ACK5IP_10270 [Paracoccus sp. (in: a-proteobacteria)]